jgi:hypothetical protein
MYSYCTPIFLQYLMNAENLISMYIETHSRSYCLLKPVNFVFQTFPLFIPKMSAGFTSYIVQIIPIYFTWIF